MNIHQRLYECADFFMVRVALLPAATSQNEEVNEPEKLLKFAKNCVLLLEAIALASPNLYKAIQKGSLSRPENLKKTYQGILKYFLRMCSRTTPFGGFSFVGWGRFSNDVQLHFDLSKVRKKARLDMEWLNALIDCLHKDREFVKAIKVMVNPNAFREGEKVVLNRFNTHAKKYDMVSIKNTSVIEEIFSLAKKPILYSDLLNQLISTFATFPQEKVENCLWSVFEGDYLLSELSFRVDKPFDLANFSEFVNSNLHNVHQETHAIARLLADLSTEIRTYEEQKSGQGVAFIENLIEKSSSWSTVDYPLQVDTYLSSNEFQLNQAIRNVIAESATVIYSLTNKYKPDLPIKAYHRNFLEKYGSNRLVPIQELVNATMGLGFPQTLQGEEGKRDWMQEMIFAGMAKQLREINVEDLVKQEIEKDPSFGQNAPDSLELFLEVVAPSLEGLARGDFTIIMNPVIGSNQAGNTFGRFLYIWDASKKESLHQFLRKEESLKSHIVRVEASFNPMKARIANVCYFETTREFQLQFHYHENTENVLGIEDIYVGATLDKLYLFSGKLGKEIHVNLTTAVNPSMAPPILKLMIDISEERYDYYNPSITQRFHHLMYLPRFKYKNVILSPARWFFTYDNLGISKNDNGSEAEKKLLAAFSDYEVPAHVFMTEFDNRLKVCWKKSHEFKLIVDKFIKDKQLILYEYLLEQEGRLVESQEGSHVAEFVVPMIKRVPVSHASLPATFPCTTQIPVLQRNKMLGVSDWLYVKLFLPANFEQEFITLYLKQMGEFFVQKNLVNKWFYVRYKEDKAHIRLRLQGVPETLVDVVFPSLSNWCSQLIDQGVMTDFSFHTYEREVERYGGLDAIEWVEDLFCVDSLICANLLECAEKKLIPLDLEYVAALSIIYMMNHFYSDSNEILQLLKPTKTEMNLLEGSRPYLKQLVGCIEYMMGHQKDKSLESLYPYYSYFQAFEMLGDEIKKLRGMFEDSPKISVWNNKHHLIDSLIHMHCNRLLGANVEMEKKGRVIAYAILNKYARSPVSVS